MYQKGEFWMIFAFGTGRKMYQKGEFRLIFAFGTGREMCQNVDFGQFLPLEQEGNVQKR